MTGGQQAHVPIAIGDYFDRSTILELKAERSGTATDRARARAALAAWRVACPARASNVVSSLVEELRRVNGSLWDAEDEIRSHIEAGDTDRVATVATKIVRLNDRRAELKAEIDRHTESAWTDNKHYEIDAEAGSIPAG